VRESWGHVGYQTRRIHATTLLKRCMGCLVVHWFAATGHSIKLLSWFRRVKKDEDNQPLPPIVRYYKRSTGSDGSKTLEWDCRICGQKNTQAYYW